ncbi:MAG: hypothetical protein QMC67_13605 [Candidatus Wallbacteria bacterium]
MGFIEDVASSVIEKLASRAKARALMSGLFASARAGDGGATEKLLGIIRKYHDLGDTKIVPLTECGALGQFNTDVRIELNPYANKKMMESGVIKEPWVVSSKQQKVYDLITKANAAVDPDKTVQTGDFIGKKILQDAQLLFALIQNMDYQYIFGQLHVLSIFHFLKAEFDHNTNYFGLMKVIQPEQLSVIFFFQSPQEIFALIG